jgi:GntR family transcriptional regulator
MIESGELTPGMQIPTEDQLIEQFHTSRNTVRGAVRELTTRGLIYTLHGKGTFVSEPVAPIVITLTSDPETGRGGGEGLVHTAGDAASGREPERRELEVGVWRATPAIARSLAISEGPEVIFRRQRIYLDGLRWARQASYYPRGLLTRAPRLLDSNDISGGTIAYLAEVGIRQDGYQDSVEWRPPDETDTGYFDLPPDGHIQVVQHQRVGFDQKGNPIRLTVTIYRADRIRFVINDGNVPRNAMGQP